MLMSIEQTFSTAQALTATAVSTNVIDLGATGTVLNAPAALVRDIGRGRPIQIIVKLLADAGGTSPTLQIDVQTDDNVGFASATVRSSSAVIVAGDAGDELWLDVHLPENTNEQFLRLNYILAGTSPTYTVTAAVVLAKQTNVVPGA